MKKIWIAGGLLLLIACKKNTSNTPNNNTPTQSDSFTLSLDKAYGSGKYKAGDTVHIFCENYTNNQMFSAWQGSDIALLNAPNEWHTWLIMPNRDVHLSAQFKTISPLNLKYETIKGRDRLKPVYSYIQSGAKDLVYLFHGTGGKASNIAGEYEWELLMNQLIDAGYNILITEAEEATTGIDANGDGKIRWSLLPLDSNANVDYANIRILTDSFVNRGLIDKNIPKYCIGMSNGGYFSTAVSYFYHFKAAISYCAQGSTYAVSNTDCPILYCMAKYDSNTEVGSAGNAEAATNVNSLNARGICSKIYLKDHCPLYPERFARDGSISLSQSTALFDELKTHGFLDHNNYFIGLGSDYINAAQSNSSDYPVYNTLNALQKNFVSAQISLSVADHRMYSDYNHASVLFLDKKCN